MYKLYYSPGAASFVIHWLLLELNATYELIPLDLKAKQQKSAEYLKLNPNGVVPTLLIDEQPFYETAALVLTLADRHNEARLVPAMNDSKRALYNQWIMHLANTAQPAFRLWFYPVDVAGEGNQDVIKDYARQRIESVWDRLNQFLGENGPYILGETISAADFFAVMLMRWSRNMPKPATQWPHLNALVKRLKTRPTFAKLYEVEGLTEWA